MTPENPPPAKTDANEDYTEVIFKEIKVTDITKPRAHAFFLHVTRCVAVCCVVMWGTIFSRDKLLM